jgi:phospholipid-translocating ATPase
LKQCLCCEPILSCPDLNLPFILQTAASGWVIEAVLSWVYKSEEHPIAYYSRKLLPHEEKHSTIEKECLAIHLGVQTFRVYLLGRPFTIQTITGPYSGWTT